MKLAHPVLSDVRCPLRKDTRSCPTFLSLHQRHKMSRTFPLHSEFFADDTKIYRELENENKSDTLAQLADIDHLTAWASWRQLCVLILTTRAEAVRICVKRQLASIRHHVTSWRQVLRVRCHYVVTVSWSEYVNVTVNNKNLVLSNELIKVELPP